MSYLVLLLLATAVIIVTLWVGFHRHRREEILQCIVSKVIRYLAKLQQVPGNRIV